MIEIHGLMFPFGLLVISSVMVIYVWLYAKRNLSIAKVISAKIMVIYLILCILVALSSGYILFEIFSRKVTPIISIAISTVSTTTLLMSVYIFLFSPIYKKWKGFLTFLIGSNPEKMVKDIKAKIEELAKQNANMEMRTADTLKNIASKLDEMYYKQKLESLEKSRNAARFMNIFVITCPIVSLAIEILFWIK